MLVSSVLQSRMDAKRSIPVTAFCPRTPNLHAPVPTMILVFIGPAPEVIDAMGEKSNAKQTMKAAGVPTVPGSDGPVESVEQARAFAEAVGYPVLIKASAGGGGKGMREVHDPGRSSEGIRRRPFRSSCRLWQR